MEMKKFVIRELEHDYVYLQNQINSEISTAVKVETAQVKTPSGGVEIHIYAFYEQE